MKPFKFKLEGLLKLRKFKEDVQKVELGKIIKEINQLKEEIVVIKKEIGEGYKSQEAILEEETSGRLLYFYPFYIEGKWEHIKYREKKIDALEKRLKVEMEKMAQIMADLKVIESLKDKKMNEYKKELTRKEYEKIDELMIQKGNRKAS